MKKDITKCELFATHGDMAGEIDLQWDSVPGATMYVIQSGIKSGKGKKIIDVCTNSRYTITGLKPKKNYVFSIAPVFINKQGPWSCEIEKRTK